MSRTERYEDIIPVDRLREVNIGVIGVGAIGRQVALMLASMGAENISLYDPDVVDEVNLGSQGYPVAAVEQVKVVAMMYDMVRLNPNLAGDALDGDPRKYRPKHPRHEVIFCCVDSITDRKAIARTCHKKETSLFVDGRMTSETFQVFTVYDHENGWDAYDDTCFPQEEAYEGSCTAKSTIYCASIAAGMMVAQFTQWLREMEPAFKVECSILAGEMYADDTRCTAG